MNAHKLVLIQRISQLFDRFAQQKAFGADVQTRVIISCLDSFNIVDADKRILFPVVNEEPFGIFLWHTAILNVF